MQAVPGHVTTERAGAERPVPRRLAWLRQEWLWIPLAIFVVARVVSGVILAAASGRQNSFDLTKSGAQLTRLDRAPGYWGMTANWDGQWFMLIAEQGYPTSLPTVDGKVVQSQWGFPAGYPMLVRLVILVTRLDFTVAASLTSMACAATAMVLIYRLLLVRGDRFFATAGVVLLNAFPAAPVFQVAYTEGMVLLLIACALTALHLRRYELLVPIIVLLALTRPLTLVVAALIALHLLRRVRSRSADPVSRRETTVLILSCGLALVATGVWPAIALVVTGDPSAYLSTMSAWAQPGKELGFRASWLVATFTEPGVILVTGGIALIVRYRLRLGSVLVPELRDWSWLYPLYMMAATTPGSGILRYFLLAIAPVCLFNPVSARESGLDKSARLVLLVLVTILMVAGQYYWVREVYTMLPTKEQPFP